MAATSHSSDDERWSDWEEDEGSEMPTQGLFAPARVFSTPAECLRAARTEHGFDLLAVANGLGMYERIQLVNFIRARTAEGEEAAALVPLITSAIASSDARPWKEERYLRSVVEGDPLLFSMGGLDGDDETDEDEDEARKGRAQEDDEMIRQALIAEPSALNGLAGGSADGVEPGAEALASQMAQMRQLLQEMAADPVEVRGTTSADTDDDEVQGEGGGAGPSSAALNQATAGGSGGSGSGGAGQVGPGRRRRGNKPRTMAEKVDEGYFGSYGELGIHHTMLSDRVRTEAYRDAIKQPWMAGKTVLDIGCGTAILSLFAASAGAEHVYGVDASGIITHALEIVRRNGMDDRVTLLRGKAEEIALPVARVDVIISEWMGYCLLYEAMLPSVLAARDKWLAPGGLVMPNKASMQLRLSSHSELTFWDDVYGYDMANVAAATGEDKEADVLVVPAETALSEQTTFKTIDIMTVTDEELDFNEAFELAVTATGTLRTFVASFETTFEPPAGASGCSVVVLKTGMLDPPTHWKQTLFHLKEPVALTVGQTVRGLIAVARLGEGRRDLDVSITFSVLHADGQVALQERSQLWQV